MFIKSQKFTQLPNFFRRLSRERRVLFFLIAGLAVLSVVSYLYYTYNGLALSYNDARSHLNISRRVVEGLNPGFGQIGSVWLPLPHILPIATVWSDFMWHSGLAGSIWSMLSFILASYMIYCLLRELGLPLYARSIGVAIFVLNLNILYLQSLAMTEMMLMAAAMSGIYYFFLWLKQNRLDHLLLSAVWIMLATLIRYDGWFLLAAAAAGLLFFAWRKWGWRQAEGWFVLFCTLAGFGVFLWLLWNLLIFGDPLFFMFGDNSAHAQQAEIAGKGLLATKGSWWLSIKVYTYALFYNIGILTIILGAVGAVWLWLSEENRTEARILIWLLFFPLIFNILALYLGHSIIFIKDIFGPAWFNVRYGIFMLPSLAVFSAYLIHRSGPARPVIISFVLLAAFFSFQSGDAVTVEDAVIGMSRKDVDCESVWLRENAGLDKEGYILISAAANDAIIFSSGLPMAKFIHEGAGDYYEKAVAEPESRARFITVRNDGYSDVVRQRLFINEAPPAGYELKISCGFSDIYELINFK
jgi:hypothetical protein